MIKVALVDDWLTVVSAGLVINTRRRVLITVIRKIGSLVGIGLDHHYSSLGVMAEKDALRHSQSMIEGRQVDSWPKRPGSSANNNSSGASVLGSIAKTALEKDFPSLRAEGKQSFSDGVGVSPTGLRTAVQSLPFGSPAIIGASDLVEVPLKVETNGTAFSPVLQAAPFCQAYAVGSTMAGLNMAKALAQEPSQIVNTPQGDLVNITLVYLQFSVDTQRIEELTLRKCKQFRSRNWQRLEFV
ncbi:hypothetical protein B296_00030495 [Ensete ventricosum]|uniref:Uncharacterized protein n=1 Tax=Ensete ventricosum TaxID=4639 RepID=A0A427AHC5_ENSVE|nr:hypothetical protein B296_00030495 [Ensete ventricosum]